MILGFFGIRTWKRWRKRKRLLQTPLTDHQCAIIVDQVPIVRKMPADLLGQLEGKINLFLDQVDFIGCDGLEVTEEMRLSIATQACLLVVNSDAWYKLRTILLYPGAFTSQHANHEGYVVTERQTVRLGESWSNGPVVLSWEHSEGGALNDEDGHNLVLHEFAHQLDDLSGHTNAIPVLSKGQTYADWERVMVSSYERHVGNVNTGRRTVLDDYGALNHVEFFAVAVEVFFEKPDRLRREEPELYGQLSALFRLKPHLWD